MAENDKIDILIVEDSPTQAERLRRLIDAQCWHGRVAGNGVRALAAIAEQRPRLVLSDIVMPEMDGYALCRAIKADPALRQVPVILVTALNDAQDIIKGLESGADNFIRKPYADDYLLARIRQLLANQDLREQDGAGRGIALAMGGQEYRIEAAPQQILDLLISTYEQAVQVNSELQTRERQVLDLNMRLAQHAAELEATNREIAVKNMELAEASRMKSAFIANMSHELRTPLNAIIGFTGALLMKLPGPLTGEQEKQLNTIRASARHLLSLINDILDVAKIEAGKMSLHPEPVHCQPLLMEAVESLRPLAAQKGLALELDLPPDPVTVQTDRRALTQIVLNLVGNGLKFTEQGRVRVQLAPPGPGLCLAISDTGQGIAAADQARLFQAFSQVDGSTTRHAEGAGLGLYLCQQLAQLLGGQITLDSALGQGSTFTLRLP
ncbi:hybrid sensor histidine kinase/response regulator [Massilia sp. TS11]|uniref:hybrid sensor histidine kinase/response regulator n=1 Tax=Massilia sp. TS11 TaxID=2908003 RepID=UPI001EDA4B90|nr:ATP-binding protein [Massilia sp. TS11]MCG2583683.1 ATP-binding protein [Massilia sp. TS11]